MARARVALLLVALVAAAGAASARGAGDRAPAATGARDAQAYVDAHNLVRSAVQKPAVYSGPWEPVPPVAWSDEVAATAQAWAEHLRDSNDCKLAHSDTRYGENLAGGKGVDAAAAVKMWASEGGRYSYSPVYAFEIPTAHYTQLVWRKTTQIGCGRATCGKRAAIVCRYSPAGNRIDQAPY